MLSAPPRSPSWVGLVLLLLLTFCAPLAGAFAPPGDWYGSLAKPTWNPPSWLFGPVWTLLYLTMAVAAWRVWRKVGWRAPLGRYGLQLALNAAWTPVFFGLREPGAALVLILALLAAIVWTIRGFARVSRPAAWLLAPYLAWTAFATVLNATLWHMNR